MTRYRKRALSGRLDRRGKVILGLAAAATVLVNAGVAVAYWKIDPQAAARSAIEVSLTGRLYGGTTDLTVTVANQNDFPVAIKGLSAATDEVTADAEHHDRGCRATGVVVLPEVLDFSWHVSAHSVDIFTVTGGVRMADGAGTACRGAVFTIPLQADSEAERRDRQA